MMNMKRPCHAMATAKHKPMYFRLRSSHAGIGPGNNLCSADIPTTRKIMGTANRTEYPIMCDTAGGVDISSDIISRIIMALIGIETSKKSPQPLSALVFSNSCGPLLIMISNSDDQPQLNPANLLTSGEGGRICR